MSLINLQRLNVVGFIIVVTLNVLANALPLNGYNTGELSDFYPNLFVPSGFTFSIWGVIYSLLLVFIIYQMRSWWSKKEVDLGIVRAIGPWFFISCMANASWIMAWHYLQTLLSVLIMLMILTSLRIIYLRIGTGKSIAMPSSDKWAVRLVFSIYFGWITVATIANVTAVLVANGWTGGGLDPVIWTVIMLAIATLIGGLMLWKYKDAPYAFVLVWAFFGIYSRHNGNPDVQLIAYTCLAGMVVLGLGALYRLRAWV
ncbi:MAG: hypothetical protein AAGJ93_15850 [Bacteroidota bacterium]